MPNKNYSNLLNNRLLQLKLSSLESLKTAYPNYAEGMVIPGQHNLDKWVQALKDIYFKKNQGMNWKSASDEVTKGWSPVEVNDFNNWTNFYTNKDHVKYSKAQANWYFSPDEGDANDLRAGETAPYAGYFVPGAIAHSEDSINKNLHSDIDFAKDSDVDDISKKEREKLIASHKKKLISRLDSVERLLRSEEGYLLTEKEYDSLMESIYSLKKKVSSLRKKSSNNSFYKDLIVRQANILIKDGFFKAASFLYVVADEDVSGTATSPAPPGEPSVPPTGAQDSPQNEIVGTPPQPMVETPATPNKTQLPGVESEGETPIGKKEKAKSTGAEAVADALGGGFNEADDDLVVFDEDETDDFNNHFMVSEAQVADLAPAEATPPAAPAPPEKAAPVVEDSATAAAPAGTPEATEEITVTEGDVFDKNLSDVLSKVTIEDVVKKIEEISKVFKTREIPRQLSVVDMMLDKLGLISFFPSLSEATNKALESNNYILTRIEGILTQLSGAIKTKEIELVHGEGAPPPQAENIRQSLEEKEKLEKERKEMRKELADKALEERSKGEAPEIEVTEEEFAPAAAPAAPTPAQPPAAPKSPPVV